MSMTKIAEITASGSAASFEFTSIPQTFTDLQILISARNGESGYFGYAYVGFNGVTTNLSMRRLRGNGSTASSGTNTALEMAANASGTTANTFNNAQVYIPNYAGSTNKSVSFDWVMENNVTEAYQQINAGLWSSTSAITSVQIYGFTNFVAGSTATLYGISRVPSQGTTTKATGGDVYQNGAYTYHVFKSSGTFTPTVAIPNAEMLIIAGGGGGGGADYCGAPGGGAGGVLSSSGLSLASGTGVSVVVGGGGAGAVNSSSFGTNGSNSVCNSLTSIGGGGGAVFKISPLSGTGLAGGSGGGGSGSTGSGGNRGTAFPGGAGTSGQGYAGGSGNGDGASWGSTGGGGGAGGPGGNGDGGGAYSSVGIGGVGGIGTNAYSTWLNATAAGVSGYIAGGGGGASAGGGAGSSAGIGGSGGGGNASLNGVPGAGVVNTGSGGGGTANANLSGAGGSGIVIIRYA